MIFEFNGKYYSVLSPEFMLAAYTLLADWYNGQADERYERMCMIGSMLEEHHDITRPIDTAIRWRQNDPEYNAMHYRLRLAIAENELRKKERDAEECDAVQQFVLYCK
jgi:hypothetical protein